MLLVSCSCLFREPQPPKPTTTPQPPGRMWTGDTDIVTALQLDFQPYGMLHRSACQLLTILFLKKQTIMYKNKHQNETKNCFLVNIVHFQEQFSKQWVKKRKMNLEKCENWNKYNKQKPIGQFDFRQKMTRDVIILLKSLCRMFVIKYCE